MTPTPTPSPFAFTLARGAKAAFALLLAFGATLRAWLCFHDDGIYWPDEIYQSLEPAHRIVFGYGLIPWEFRDGARNWTFPAIVAGLLKAVTFVAGEAPRGYLLGMRLVFSAIGMLTAWGIYRLARAYGASWTGAALAAVLFALAPPAIYFAPRALSETGSALPLVFGLALVLAPPASGRRGPLRDVLGGTSLLGLSVLIRIQNGVFCVALLGALVGRRRWRDLALATLVLCFWAFLYGAIDRLTWGTWFHAAIAYLRANIVENKGAQWGVSESTYYLRVLWTSMPLVAVFALPLALAGVVRAPELLGMVVLDLLALSRVDHKEYRFALPMIPVWFALAGVGFSVLERAVARLRWSAMAGAAVIATCAAIAGARFHDLTFGDIGQYEPQRSAASAYDDFGPVNRLLLVAHDRADLCGIMIEAAHLAWTGGSTYLHRYVPIYSRGDYSRAPHYNYVLAYGGFRGGRVVASEGPLALVNVGPSCVPDPGYNWWLP
jgi:hypothetical protein